MYGELVVKIGTRPSAPGKPIDTASDFAVRTIDITWARPAEEGGWPLLQFEIYVDDGADNWPSTPTITLIAGALDLDNLS
jgi:hypothetical protein